MILKLILHTLLPCNAQYNLKCLNIRDKIIKQIKSVEKYYHNHPHSIILHTAMKQICLKGNNSCVDTVQLPLLNLRIPVNITLYI